MSENPLTFKTEEQIAQLLVRADSILSLIGHRFRSRLPEDLIAEALEVSQECRSTAEMLVP